MEFDRAVRCCFQRDNVRCIFSDRGLIDAIGLLVLAGLCGGNSLERAAVFFALDFRRGEATGLNFADAGVGPAAVSVLDAGGFCASGFGCFGNFFGGERSICLTCFGSFFGGERSIG